MNFKKANLRVTETTKCGRVDSPSVKNWKSGPSPFFNLPETTYPPRPAKTVQSGIVVPIDKEEKAHSSHQTELKTKIVNSNEKTHRKKKKTIQGMSGDLTLDINGNFSQPRHQSGLSRNSSAMQSSVSRNGDGYERQSSKSDSTHRKFKHTRNPNDGHCYMLSEGISGLQSLNNIEEHPSDKKYKVNKSAGIGGGGTRKIYYSQNLSSGNKSMPSEEVTKKDRIKDTKSNFNSNKNWRNSSKQRCFPVHDSSEEEKEINTMNFKRNPQNEGGDNENVSSAACATNSETYLDWSTCVPDPSEDKNPDSSLSSEILPTSVISNSNCTNSSFVVDGEVSSFVRDFYAVTDPEQQQEESEFKVVVKKQRKHQQPRLDSCRRYSAASGSTGSDHECTQGRSHTDKIMFLAGLPVSHRTQLRKLDSFHCKSTSSMPPSEHSSADNSDLDSVHSLPVGSSASNASCSASLPATSSTSATLQASYADIARSTMPSASKSHTCNIRQTQTVHVKIAEQNSANYSEISSVIVHNAAASKQIPSDYPSENLHGIKPCIDSNEGIMFHPSTDNSKEAFYASPLDPVKKSSFVSGLHFTSKNEEDKEIVTNKHRSNLQSDVADNSELTCVAFSQKSQHRVPNSSSHLETCIDSIQSQWVIATSKKNTDDSGNVSNEIGKSAFVKHKADAKQKQPAVIIMDNCLPTGNVSGVSFGIDFNELLQLNSGNEAIQISPVPLPSDASLTVTPSKVELVGQSLDKRTETESHMKSTLHSGHSQSSTNQKACEDKGHIPSPHVIAGLGIRWKDLAVDTRTFNYEQIVNFLYKAWDDAIQESTKGIAGREGIRMKYYSDTNP